MGWLTIQRAWESRVDGQEVVVVVRGEEARERVEEKVLLQFSLFPWVH